MAEAVDGDLRVGPRVTVPAADLGWRFSRSSGPGGQGVNTTDSRVELVLDLRTAAGFTDAQRERVLHRLGPRLHDGVLVVAASETRSQLRNREAARIRVRDLLADALAPGAPRRRPTRPTRGSQRRRVDTKVARGQVKKLRGRPPRGGDA